MCGCCLGFIWCCGWLVGYLVIGCGLLGCSSWELVGYWLGLVGSWWR